MLSKIKEFHKVLQHQTFFVILYRLKKFGLDRERHNLSFVKFFTRNKGFISREINVPFFLCVQVSSHVFFSLNKRQHQRADAICFHLKPRLFLTVKFFVNYLSLD